MNAQEMLDYVFHQMDERSCDLAEHAIEADPALGDRLSRLRRSISLLVDDGEAYAPPPGLAARTVARVERRKSRPQVQDLIPVKAPFRMADFAVAATVFFAAVFTLSVPILKSRAQMDQAACAFNLGKLGVSLANYRNTHGGYPLVPVSHPAGSYAVMLQDSRTLSDPGVLVCPTCSKVKSPSSLPDYENFCRMVKDSPNACRELLDGHYAYNVGYESPSGDGTIMPAETGSGRPIASDAPAFSPDGTILEGNSPNHGGHGQNVLHCDGRVSFRTRRWVSNRDQDLFLNERQHAGPGVHKDDSALVPSILPAR
jgi:hypothetical protein